MAADCSSFYNMSVANEWPQAWSRVFWKETVRLFIGSRTVPLHLSTVLHCGALCTQHPLKPYREHFIKSWPMIFSSVQPCSLHRWCCCGCGPPHSSGHIRCLVLCQVGNDNVLFPTKAIVLSSSFYMAPRAFVQEKEEEKREVNRSAI